MFPAVVEQLGELAWIAQCRCVLELAGRVEGDAGLGGVAHDKPCIFCLGQPQVGSMVLVGVDGTRDALYPLYLVDDLSLLHALHAYVVAALLFEEAFQAFAWAGLHDCHAVLLHHPVYKGPEKIAFAELYYLHCRCFFSGVEFPSFIFL